MINLFKISPYDQSINYLAQIFGSMNKILTPPGVNIASPFYNPLTDSFIYRSVDIGDYTMLSAMFNVFNSVVLAVAALIVVYVTVVGVMASAHEGEFMGKKFDKLWMPLRMIMGIIFLVPTATGYSTLQLIMMWIIVQGVGAADTVWKAALDFGTDPTKVAQLQAEKSTQQVQASDEQLTLLFQNVLCDETARFNKKVPPGISYDGVQFYCYENPNTAFCSRSPDPNLPLSGGKTIPNNAEPNAPLSYVFGPQGSCGLLTYCNPSTAAGGKCENPNSLQCKVCQKQGPVLNSIISTFRSIAKNFVSIDYNLIVVNFWEEAAGDDEFTQGMVNYCAGLKPSVGREECDYTQLPDPTYTKQSPSANAVSYLYWPYVIKPIVVGPSQSNDPNFIKLAQDNYRLAFANLIDNEQKPGGSADIQLKGAFKNAYEIGWIFAGAFYYNIAQVSNKQVKASGETFNVSPQPTDDNELNKMDKEGNSLYRSNFKAGNYLVKASQGQPVASAPGSEATSGLSEASSNFGVALAKLIAPNQANPLITLQKVGYELLYAAIWCFAAFSIATVILGLLSGINAFALGNGGINPMFVMTTVLYMLLVPLMFAILGLMIAIGALLGVYVPLIPYIIFTMGALGWLTACIEAMVAGPLVALAILSPGGHHELLGKAEHAILLMFNVFLRPSLMIFGLVAASLLANVGVLMVNTAFGMVVLTIVGQATADNPSAVDTNGLDAVGALMSNPIEAVFFLVAYVVLILSVLNKCFAAIHIIPERVMSWIGGQGMQFGEGEALQESKQAITGAAQKAGHGMESAGKAGGEAGKETGKHGQEGYGKAQDAKASNQARHEEAVAKKKGGDGAKPDLKGSDTSGGDKK